MWAESMSAIINPLVVPSTSLPSIEEILDPDNKNKGTTVGGSYYVCINPATFGSIEKVKQRSDEYVTAIESCPPRPGHTVRTPGSTGYQQIKDDNQNTEVITAHWDAFFGGIAGRYGLSEELLRSDFTEQHK